MKFFRRYLNDEYTASVVCDVDKVPAVGDYFDPLTDQPEIKAAQRVGHIFCVELVIFTPGRKWDVEVYGYRVNKNDVFSSLRSKDGEQ